MSITQLDTTKTISLSTGLPSRYQIKQLTPEHVEWASAIVAHSNIFHSTVFSTCCPENKTQRFNVAMTEIRYLIEHQIESTMSYGVFDQEYVYKRPESVKTNGKFYFDANDDSVTGDDLLAAMDFPLVSVAVSYDGANPLDHARLAPLLPCLPVFAGLMAAIEKCDKRDDSWKATRHGQVLMRNGSSTRHEYEGKGLMAAMARFLMKEAERRGYESVNIECLNDAVTHVWSEPPAPYKGEVVSEFRCDEYEVEDENGQMVKPFWPSKQRVTRVFTNIKV